MWTLAFFMACAAFLFQNKIVKRCLAITAMVISAFSTLQVFINLWGLLIRWIQYGSYNSYGSYGFRRFLNFFYYGENLNPLRWVFMGFNTSHSTWVYWIIQFERIAVDVIVFLIALLGMKHSIFVKTDDGKLYLDLKQAIPQKWIENWKEKAARRKEEKAAEEKAAAERAEAEKIAEEKAAAERAEAERIAAENVAEEKNKPVAPVMEEKVEVVSAPVSEVSNIEKIEEGVKFCSNCGAKLQKDSLFCSSCGTKQGPVEKQKCFCPGCGKELTSEDAFCPNCGTKNPKAGNTSEGNAEKVAVLRCKKPGPGNFVGLGLLGVLFYPLFDILVTIGIGALAGVAGRNRLYGLETALGVLAYIFLAILVITQLVTWIIALVNLIRMCTNNNPEIALYKNGIDARYLVKNLYIPLINVSSTHLDTTKRWYFIYGPNNKPLLKYNISTPDTEAQAKVFDVELWKCKNS